MLKEGDLFPDFDLQDQNGQQHSLDSIESRPFVIYFYPKDDTPGCTKEACSFRDSIRHFDGIAVLGVSPDSVKSHLKFANKFDLPFTLLADVDLKLIKACGLWVEKKMYGKTYMGVQRATFIVGKDNRVLKSWPKVTPEDHAEDVLTALKEIDRSIH